VHKIAIFSPKPLKVKSRLKSLKVERGILFSSAITYLKTLIFIGELEYQSFYRNAISSLARYFKPTGSPIVESKSSKYLRKKFRSYYRLSVLEIKLISSKAFSEGLVHELRKLRELIFKKKLAAL
jgi:hypothetical protein